MGVRINGVWHEELADPGSGGTDNGNGRNFDQANDYSAASKATKWGANLNTSVGGGSALLGTVPSGDTGGGGLQQLLNALASGNVAAANEAIRQFNVTSGLDAQKFAESVNEYNQNHGMAMTKQAADIAAQAAGISGMFDGAPTEAARQFNVSAQQAAIDEQNKTALGALNLRATMQNDPFRQLDNEYATAGNSGLSKAIAGLTTQYGLANPFASPGTGGSFVAPGSAQAAAAQTGLTNPNQIISREFNSAPSGVQNAATSALSMNTGMNQADLTKQIQKNLPQFNAPSFGLSAV